MTIQVNLSASDANEILTVLRQTWDAQAKRHEQLMQGLQKLTDATVTLTTALTDNTKAVDAAVTDINTLSPTDAQLSTIADALTSQTAILQNNTQRLLDAVSGPAPTPTPAQ